MESLSDVMSGGNGVNPPANPTGNETDSAGGAERGRNPGAEGAGEGSGKARLAAWTQQLPKEYRENPEYSRALAEFENLEGFAKKFFEMSKGSAVPGDGASPEERSAFWKKLGYPDEPGQYSVAKEEGTETFISAAHKAGLTDGQAKAMWETVKEGVKAQAAEAEARQKALHEAQRKQLAETDAELKAQYGDRYGHALEMLRRGVGDSGIDAALAQAGLGGNPLVIRAFIALGESMKESASPKGASSAAGGMKSVLEGGGFTYKA